MKGWLYMNPKKHFIGGCLLFCSFLTACSFNPFPSAIPNNTTEGLEELNADGFIALNENDKEDSVLATSQDGRFTYRANHINGITLVSDGGQVSGELIIPETIDGHKVTKIGLSAYANSQITKVVIPNGVKIIEDMAFNNCEVLQEVVLGTDVVEIGDGSFMNCYSLETITLNNGVYRIGHSAFSACYDLQSIQFPESVEIIDKYCFTNSGLTEISLPSKLYYIAEGTFMGCSKLGKVLLPETLAIIDHLAFADCENLDLTIVDSCQQICSTAFQNSAAIEVLPETIFEPKTLTYEGDFSEFENPQIVKYFYSNKEMESTSNE